MFGTTSVTKDVAPWDDTTKESAPWLRREGGTKEGPRALSVSRRNGYTAHWEHTVS